jgi:phage/plasmid-associated DNA primase
MVTSPNPRLAAELLAEKSGIFNWMLGGARRLDKAGFSYTTDPEEMAKRYIERSEPIAKFLEECCIEDFDGFESSKKLYATYNAWARHNHKKKMGSRDFLNSMRSQTVFPAEYHKKTNYERDERGYLIDVERPWGFDGLKLIKNVEAFSTLSP